MKVNAKLLFAVLLVFLAGCTYSAKESPKTDQSADNHISNPQPEPPEKTKEPDETAPEYKQFEEGKYEFVGIDLAEKTSSTLYTKEYKSPDGNKILTMEVGRSVYKEGMGVNLLPIELRFEGKCIFSSSVEFPDADDNIIWLNNQRALLFGIYIFNTETKELAQIDFSPLARDSADVAIFTLTDYGGYVYLPESGEDQPRNCIVSIKVSPDRKKIAYGVFVSYDFSSTYLDAIYLYDIEAQEFDLVYREEETLDFWISNWLDDHTLVCNYQERTQNEQRLEKCMLLDLNTKICRSSSEFSEYRVIGVFGDRMVFRYSYNGKTLVILQDEDGTDYILEESSIVRDRCRGVDFSSRYIYWWDYADDSYILTLFDMESKLVYRIDCQQALEGAGVDGAFLRAVIVEFNGVDLAMVMHPNDDQAIESVTLRYKLIK